MKKNIFYFLFMFLGLFLISHVKSAETIFHLQTSISCSRSNDQCVQDRSFCNFNGKCQCRLGYSPSTDHSQCELFRCSSTAECSKLYHDSNVTCELEFGNRCHCGLGFQLDPNTQKCMLKNPNSRRLGSHCVADHQCGINAECTTAGECRCPAGSKREADYSCDIPPCTSNEFCHNITANTVCTRSHEDLSYCKCPEPIFTQDDETFECVRVLPDPLLLGAHCNNSTDCGQGADCTTGSHQICKCKLGFSATSDTACEPAHCSSNEICQSITKHTVCDDFRCKCPEPIFKEDPKTFECVRMLPDHLLLGAHCNNSTDCGEGAGCTTGSQQICKCQLGFEATSDTVCEPVHCSKDEHCHKNVSPLTTCSHDFSPSGEHRYNSHCECKSGYYVNPQTLECSLIGPNLGKKCVPDSDEDQCGINAVCNKDGKCVCAKGYEPGQSPSGEYCREV